MITKSDMRQLKKLAKRVQAGTLMDDEEIRLTQRLVSAGLARDLSAFAGTRQRIYLRIWQITDAGRAVLAQEALSANPNGQGFLLSTSEN